MSGLMSHQIGAYFGVHLDLGAPLSFMAALKNMAVVMLLSSPATCGYVTALSALTLTPRLRQRTAATESVMMVPAEQQPELREATWTPSMGFIRFTVDMYMAMIGDQARTAGFKEAIERRLRDRDGCVVLDIGTGPFAILAIFAAQAGAAKVYAIEANAAAAKQAQATVDGAVERGDIESGVIVIIEGFSTTTTLPERADLLVAEIVGSIASEEGMYTTIRDARHRHLKRPADPKSYIPARCQTVAAPVAYSLHHRSDWDTTASLVRLECSSPWLAPLATPQLWEDFAFGGEDQSFGPGLHALTPPLDFCVTAATIAANGQLYAKQLELNGMDTDRAAKMAQTTACSLSGVACWPRLVLDEGGEDEGGKPIIVESRGMSGEARYSHWQTVLLLLSTKPTCMHAGDVITVQSEIEIGAEVDTPPRYTMRASIERN
jgi:hypothetical protein